MIIRPKDRLNILISGSFVALLLVVVAVSIFMLSSEKSFFTKQIELFAQVNNAQNLKRGAEVQLRGVKVGTVSSIEVSSLENLTVSFTVDQSFQNWIRQDSYIAFKTHGVLGDRYLEILGGTDEAGPISSGEQLQVKDDSVIDKFITRGEDILVVAARVLQRVDHILENLEADQLNTILKQLDQTTSATSQLMSAIKAKDLKELVQNLSTGSRDLKKSLGSIQTITKQIEEGPGSLHSLIYDRSVHDDLKTILGGTKRNRVLQYFIRESIKKAD